MERVTVVCFLASYAVALGLEVWHQYRPRPIVRLVGLAFGGAGLLAQTIYLAVQRPPLVWQAGWMLFLSWVLAIFYLAGSVHHRRQAWGLFVLPLVLALIGLSSAFGPPRSGSEGVLAVQDFWGRVHALVLFLAAVGVCVGFLASLMYLFQARRLRTKALPGKGLRLLSLERLESMNRRAINLAFPLLTAGVVIGATLLLQERDLPGWTDPRVLSTLVLWLAFAVLVFLRYGYHLRGRSVAVLTIAVFFLLLGCLAMSHPVGQGGGR
ncbi:MAG TPA: cytochrome c biogenesis protein CcsA [Gemmataceae bacterium]|jgi:ABC-type transport system involved in cytochrome c biogenesis permease subunit|nr:cytochrome c biogenesis protein CcsA [Gemmataceae bacterium]